MIYAQLIIHTNTDAHAFAPEGDVLEQAANYVLAPLILVVFVIVVSFVLLNMVRCVLFFRFLICR